jgi:hypothetical protein
MLGELAHMATDTAEVPGATKGGLTVLGNWYGMWSAKESLLLNINKRFIQCISSKKKGKTVFDFFVQNQVPWFSPIGLFGWPTGPGCGPAC